MGARPDIADVVPKVADKARIAVHQPQRKKHQRVLMCPLWIGTDCSRLESLAGRNDIC